MDDKKLEQLLQFNKEQERKRLFQEVGKILLAFDPIIDKDIFIKNTTFLTDILLQASEDFAKEQE